MSLSIEVLSTAEVPTRQAGKKIKAFLSLNQHDDGGDMRSTPKLSSVPEDVLSSLKQLHDAIKSEDKSITINSSKKQGVSEDTEVAESKAEEPRGKKRSKVAVVVEDATPIVTDDENNQEEVQTLKKAKKDKKKSK